jgi:hypothetical protein
MRKKKRTRPCRVRAKRSKKVWTSSPLEFEKQEKEIVYLNNIIQNWEKYVNK